LNIYLPILYKIMSIVMAKCSVIETLHWISYVLVLYIYIYIYIYICWVFDQNNTCVLFQPLVQEFDFPSSGFFYNKHLQLLQYDKIRKRYCSNHDMVSLNYCFCSIPDLVHGESFLQCAFNQRCAGTNSIYPYKVTAMWVKFD